MKFRDQGKADTILHGGRILTCCHDDSIEQAVVIRGELVQAVGSDQDVLAFRNGLSHVVHTVLLARRRILGGILRRASR